ncbi:MAG: glutamate racemase [Thermoflexus sp.]|uniref:glutamate racemase n=1 Tax=Thermoflexus sp. TaxID=1969742 RepID=UPI0025FCD971|nr:glutamate racemase [Thermoflexus sp.]MCS6962797.1 glutamate racemase [Thermoflexus sp.]MDW8184727.1 glutamate racemase [Anaerolineae bacterium]
MTSWVGIFDSGVGGLAVWQEFVRLAPEAPTLYVADQAHVPYGPRPPEEIRRFAEAITRFLLDQGARLIVVASHTISAAALWPLREAFPRVPFVGIEPAVKPAAAQTRTGVIGVLATSGTLNGPLMARVVERFAQQVQVIRRVCSGWVEQVEAGLLEGEEAEAQIRHHLDPVVRSGADVLVLACTHYTFLAPLIRRVAGPGISLVDPAPAVARRAAEIWRAQIQEGREAAPKGARGGLHAFFTTGDPQRFQEQLRQLIGRDGPVERLRWDTEGALREATG